MELVILGSGTCVPSVRRAGPGACLITRDQTVLVDSAAGTLRQLAKAGISYEAIDLILYTHLHPDHVGDFVPYIFATKYAPGFHRRIPATVMAGEGFRDFHEALKKAFGHWVETDPAKVVIDEIPTHMPTALQLPPLTLRTSPVRHTPQSLAYRIEAEEGKSVVFSGDTDFSPELIELSRDVDLLVLECAAPEGQKVQGHLTPSEAGTIAQEAQVKQLVLTHFYPECDLHDLVSPCARIYKGPILLAEDLMRIHI